LKLIKIDEPVKIIMTPLFVIPAKAGMTIIYECIKIKQCD